MKTATQFAEEIRSISEGIDISGGNQVVEEIADWRGPLQDVQVRLRRMIQQDIDKFMESAQKILTDAEKSDWSKTVIQNSVARWSKDINRVYADFKNSTQGFTDLVKAMGIPMRRHSTKGQAPAKRGKMDWGSLSQAQLKKEIHNQVQRLSQGIHSLADDGSYMLHQIDKILKYKSPQEQTIVDEIGALFQDFVDFRNAFGSKVWGPYNGLIGRLNAIPAKPVGKYGKEYAKAMRTKPSRMVASSDLPIDCPELREAIERDRLRATRGVLGEDRSEAQALIEAIEYELLGESGGKEARIAKKMKAKGYDYKITPKGDIEPLYAKTMQDALKVHRDYPGSEITKNESNEIEGELLGEMDDDPEKGAASKMKAKGYDFKILLKKGPPLYTKTEKGAKDVQKDYPGSKIVKNESGEIDDPAVIEAAEHGDLFDFFEDFDSLIWGGDDGLSEEGSDGSPFLDEARQYPGWKRVAPKRGGVEYVKAPWIIAMDSIGGRWTIYKNNKKVGAAANVDDAIYQIGQVKEDFDGGDELTEMSEVVKTIFQQFGGGRSMMMIGGQAMAIDGNTLGIKWPSRHPARIGNYVEIAYLPGADLYDMEFFNIRGGKKKSVKKFKHIYADQLVDTFEDHTAWYLRL